MLRFPFFTSGDKNLTPSQIFVRKSSINQQKFPDMLLELVSIFFFFIQLRFITNLLDTKILKGELLNQPQNCPIFGQFGNHLTN